MNSRQQSGGASVSHQGFACVMGGNCMELSTRGEHACYHSCCALLPSVGLLLNQSCFPHAEHPILVLSLSPPWFSQLPCSFVYTFYVQWSLNTWYSLLKASSHPLLSSRLIVSLYDFIGWLGSMWSDYPWIFVLNDSFLWQRRLPGQSNQFCSIFDATVTAISSVASSVSWAECRRITDEALSRLFLKHNSLFSKFPVIWELFDWLSKFLLAGLFCLPAYLHRKIIGVPLHDVWIWVNLPGISE